jgi:hypothetical protein
MDGAGVAVVVVGVVVVGAEVVAVELEATVLGVELLEGVEELEWWWCWLPALRGSMYC